MRKQFGVPAAEPFHPTGVNPYLWTPYGPRFLGELPLDRGEWKPCFLGTFDTDAWERPFSDVVEDSPSAPAKHCHRLINVDEEFTTICDSSHDSDLVLG